MTLPHHMSVAKIYRDAAERMEQAEKKGDVAEAEAYLQKYLDESGPINGKAYLELGRLGHLYGAGAVDAYGKSNVAQLSNMLELTLGCKSMELRLQQALSATIPDKPDNRPREFEDSLNAALPFALSRWTLAQICAAAFLWLADKDQRLRVGEARCMSNGTTDAFLNYLFSNALDLPTRYKPEDMLEDCYQVLLDDWRTTDLAVFEHAMAGAIDFHIRRSKYSTDHTHFEFDHIFEMVFPVELLALLALRKRLNLPGFKTSHALVDGPRGSDPGPSQTRSISFDHRARSPLQERLSNLHLAHDASTPPISQEVSKVTAFCSARYIFLYGAHPYSLAFSQSAIVASSC